MCCPRYSDAKYCSESAQSMDEYKPIARCRVGAAAYGQTISVSLAAAFGPSTANTMADVTIIKSMANLSEHLFTN